jgi:hypothetical protein
MNCPIRTLPEWKALVAEVGDTEAMYLYIKNNFEIPTELPVLKPDKFTWTIEEKSEVEVMKKLTDIVETTLINLSTKLNMYKKDEEYGPKLKDLVTEFVEADTLKSVGSFLTKGINDVRVLRERIQDVKGDLQYLKTLKDFAESYSMVYEIAEVLANKNFKGLDILQPQVDALQTLLNKFNQEYKVVAKVEVSKALSNFSTTKTREAKLKYSSEYSKLNPRKDTSISTKKYNENKVAYVEQKLNENRTQIYQEEQAFIEGLVSFSHEDIGGIVTHASDQRNVNDAVIQMTVKMYDNADFNVNKESAKVKKEAVKVWEDFLKKTQAKGIILTDEKKVYEGIIEKIESKETNYYVRPMYSTFYEEYFNMLKQLAEIENELAETGLPLSQQELYARKNEVRNAWREKHFIAPKDKDGNWKNMKFWQTEAEIKPEFRNPQYKALDPSKSTYDTVKGKMYKYLTDFNAESDKLLKYGKLGYKLPGQEKTTGEQITDNGFIKAAKRGIKESYQVLSSDADYGDIDENGKLRITTDISGKITRKIAVPFRNKIDIENQSFDLMGMALTNRHIALNFNEKDKIKTTIEMLKDLIFDRNVLEKTGNLEILKNSLNFGGNVGREIDDIQNTFKGSQSNVYKLFNSIMEDRLYGIHDIQNVIGNVSLDKISKKLIGFSAHQMLIFNWMGGTANLVNGKTMNFLEACGGRFYDKKNLVNAEKKYWGDIHKIVNDIEALTPSSKTNLLRERFLDTSADFNFMVNELTRDARYKRLFSISTLHGINGSAEHYIGSSLMYAILDNIKMKNASGEYINVAGETVDRENAMSLDQAYSVDDQGNLYLTIANAVAEGYGSHNMESRIRSRIKEITKDLQGQYDTTNRSMMEREYYGKLFNFLRKWMLTGIQKRWMGIDHTNKAFEDLETHERFYSESLEDYKEGTYTSLWRYIKSMKRSATSLRAGVVSEQWDTLTDMEKSNIRHATVELGIMFGALTASALLAGLAKGADDDDERQRLYFLAYLTRRTYSELAFYVPYNPAEAIRFLQTPTATITTLQSFTQMMGQFSEDMLYNVPLGDGLEQYQKGINKGNSKSFVMFNKTFNPLAKQFTYRSPEKSYNFLVNSTY